MKPARCLIGVIALASLSVMTASISVSSAFAQQQEGARDATGIDAEARSFYDLGRVQFDNERFAAAAESWQRAFELSNRTVLLYNIYLAHDRATQAGEAEHARGAERALRLYLDRSPTTMDERPELEGRLADLVQLVEALPAEETQPQDEAEPVADTATEPVVEEQQGVSLAEDAPLRVSASAADEPSHGLAWALMGVGAAALIGASITGVMTSGVEADLEAGCNADTLECDASFADDIDRRDSLALITDVSLATGAALVVTGLIIRLTGGNADDSLSSRVRVGAEVTSTRAVGAVHVSF